MLTSVKIYKGEKNMAMGPVYSRSRTDFENKIRALETQISTIGIHLHIDARARMHYMQQVKAMANKLRDDALSGRISWEAAAKEAQETRNLVMEITRKHSTPVGRSIAEYLKKEGKTFNELIERNTYKLYGDKVIFDQLDDLQKNRVYAAIVKSAGTPRANVNNNMRALSNASRGLIVVAIAISVYNVAKAEDKLEAAGYEAATAGAGVVGGIAGGAGAGFVCGPASPICVTVGAFVGGALAAFGVSFIW